MEQLTPDQLLAASDEERAWQRLRAQILRCQAESVMSESGEASPLSLARVHKLSDDLVELMDRKPAKRVA